MDGEVYLWAILLGLIPAMIASKKGYSFVLWWIYGAALLIIALPNALLLDSKVELREREERAHSRRKCPFCAEMIRREAIVCKHCSRDLPPLKELAFVRSRPNIRRPNASHGPLIAFLIVVVSIVAIVGTFLFLAFLSG